MLQNLTYGLRA